MRVRSLRREDFLEKEMATHSSIFAWNPTDRGAWRTTVHGVAELDTQDSAPKNMLLCTTLCSTFLNFIPQCIILCKISQFLLVNIGYSLQFSELYYHSFPSRSSICLTMQWGLTLVIGL